MNDPKADDVVLDTLIERMHEEAEARRHVKSRIDLLIWIAVAMLTLATVSVVIRMVNYYGLRSDIVIRNEEVRLLTQGTSDLTRRVNKLRAEVAIRDARFLASKGVVQNGGELPKLLAIQAVIDRYALEHLRNGDAEDKTSDDVRREVCDVLSKAGYPCVP